MFNTMQFDFISNQACFQCESPKSTDSLPVTAGTSSTAPSLDTSGLLTIVPSGAKPEDGPALTTSAPTNPSDVFPASALTISNAQETNDGEPKDDVSNTPSPTYERDIDMSSSDYHESQVNGANYTSATFVAPDDRTPAHGVMNIYTGGLSDYERQAQVVQQQMLHMAISGFCATDGHTALSMIDPPRPHYTQSSLAGALYPVLRNDDPHQELLRLGNYTPHEATGPIDRSGANAAVFAPVNPTSIATAPMEVDPSLTPDFNGMSKRAHPRCFTLMKCTRYHQ
jgi:hypothetical protein